VTEQVDAPHDAFWAWWTAEGAEQYATAIADGTVADLVEELSERVRAVSPDLAWELGPGLTSQHVLVVTAEGKAETRATARRWLRAAPEPDATWEYADARPAELDPGAGGLRIGDVEVDLADVRVAAQRVGNHVDVAVHHPRLRDLPEQARGTVVFLSLDQALGENDCETWIGAVEAALDPPADGLTLLGLRDLVSEVRDDATGDDGEPVWVLLRGEHEGVPMTAAAQVPLAPAWAPHLDAHLAVVVPYADARPDGLPEPDKLDALRDLEDHLTERLAGSARLVAHETERGHRTLHYYVDSTLPGAAVAEAAVVGWPDGPVQVEQNPDPSWYAVRHLRT
jgi:hypothetical protein